MATFITADQVNNSTTGLTCQDYFSSENEAYSEPDLSKCVEITTNFRALNPSNKLGAEFSLNGYILPLEDINALLSQNGGDINGIKLYLGLDVDENNNQVIRVIVVGTYQSDQD